MTLAAAVIAAVVMFSTFIPHRPSRRSTTTSVPSAHGSERDMSMDMSRLPSARSTR